VVLLVVGFEEWAASYEGKGQPNTLLETARTCFGLSEEVVAVWLLAEGVLALSRVDLPVSGESTSIETVCARAWDR
jgi:hypothetical protein